MTDPGDSALERFTALLLLIAVATDDPDLRRLGARLLTDADTDVVAVLMTALMYRHRTDPDPAMTHRLALALLDELRASITFAETLAALTTRRQTP